MKKDKLHFKLLKGKKLIDLLELMVKNRISPPDKSSFQKVITESRHCLNRLGKEMKNASADNDAIFKSVERKTQETINKIQIMIVKVDSIAHGKKNNE